MGPPKQHSSSSGSGENLKVPLPPGIGKVVVQYTVLVVQATKPLGSCGSRNKLLFLCNILRENPPTFLDNHDTNQSGQSLATVSAPSTNSGLTTPVQEWIGCCALGTTQVGGVDG